MNKRYQIWDKVSPVITPVGEFLTPEQWIERYPAAAHISYVVAAGEVNGAFCTPLAQMEQVYASSGCDLSACATAEEKLAAIEAFEDTRNAEAVSTVSAEERTAAALELLALTSMPDAAV